MQLFSFHFQKQKKLLKKKDLLGFCQQKSPKGNPPLTKENLTKRDIEKYLHPLFYQAFTFYRRKTQEKSIFYSFSIGSSGSSIGFGVLVRASLIRQDPFCQGLCSRTQGVLRRTSLPLARQVGRIRSQELRKRQFLMVRWVCVSLEVRRHLLVRLHVR